MKTTIETTNEKYIKILQPIVRAALWLFAPYTRLQFNDKLNGANSTKPLLYAGSVD